MCGAAMESGGREPPHDPGVGDRVRIDIQDMSTLPGDARPFGRSQDTSTVTAPVADISRTPPVACRLCMWRVAILVYLGVV